VFAFQPSKVVAWGLIVSIHRDCSKALILGGSEESVSAEMRVLHQRGHMPALALDNGDLDQFAGGVFDALGQRLDPSSLEPIAPSLPEPILIGGAEGEDATAASESSIAAAAHESGRFPLLTYPAPALTLRSTAHRFLPTGLMHLDAFHPVAEGLRIGIVGTKRSGKSSLAASVLGSFAQQQREYEEALARHNADPEASKSEPPPQPNLPVPLRCIYVCVGQSRFDTRQLLERLQRNGAMAAGATVVVAAQDDPMGMQYLAPFWGATLSDLYRAHGQSSVVVYDDLAAHGHVLTQINRLYGQPILAPNYIHARLLERTAPLAEGGASSTALVLVETGRSDRTLDVNENLASFVDHALWLDADLAAKGLFPAVSCSSVLGRPGARYRPLVLRHLSNRVSSSLLSAERFVNSRSWGAEFGLDTAADEGDADPPLATYRDKCQLLLSQRASDRPFSLAEQLVLLFAMQKDEELLASVSVNNVWKYRALLLQRVKETKGPFGAGLFERLEQEVARRTARGWGGGNGGSQAVSAGAGAVHAHGPGPLHALGALDERSAEAKALGIAPGTPAPAPVPSSSSAMATDVDPLWTQLSLVLDQFNHEFQRDYEF
jgi:F0F1-type ATP synthase alpha subunit